MVMKKKLIKNVHFEKKYEELVATVARVDKSGISKIENVQVVAEIFALDMNEGWITSTAKAYVAKINRKFSASKTRNAMSSDMKVMEADPLQKNQVRTPDSTDSSKTVHRSISTSEFKTSACEKRSRRVEISGNYVFSRFSLTGDWRGRIDGNSSRSLPDDYENISRW